MEKICFLIHIREHLRQLDFLWGKLLREERDNPSCQTTFAQDAFVSLSDRQIRRIRHTNTGVGNVGGGGGFGAQPQFWKGRFVPQCERLFYVDDHHSG